MLPRLEGCLFTKQQNPKPGFQSVSFLHNLFTDIRLVLFLIPMTNKSQDIFLAKIFYHQNYSAHLLIHFQNVYTQEFQSHNYLEIPSLKIHTTLARVLVNLATRVQCQLDRKRICHLKIDLLHLLHQHYRKNRCDLSR